MRSMKFVCGLAMVVSAWAATAVYAGAANAGEHEPGRKIYVSKCAKCHRFYEPRNYSDEDWDRWMDKMSRKSKLKPEQERELRAYLADYRGEGKPREVRQGAVISKQ